MIRPRWNRPANALLATLGGSSRTLSSSSRRLEQHQHQHQQNPSPEGKQEDHGIANDIDEFPSRRQLDRARRELLKIGRERAGSGRQSAAWPQLSRRSRQEGAEASVDDRAQQNSVDDDVTRGCGSTGGDGGKTTPHQQVWPQLKRRQRRPDIIVGGAVAAVYGSAATSIPDKNQPTGLSKESKRLGNDSSRPMLVIDGLSPNLRASDFYRLAPNDLANWKSVIKKVQQQRDTKTLEPLGRYLVSFHSADAAVSYRDRLLQLHRLSILKLKSASGLWEGTVPSSLRAALASSSSSGVSTTTNDASTATPSPTAAISNDDLAELVDTFTLAPGSQSTIDIHRKRVAVQRPWAQNLAAVVAPLGYGEKPPVVLLDVYPPTLTAKELFEFIRLDGHNRGLRWQVCMPQHLKLTASAAAAADAPAAAAIKPALSDTHMVSEQGQGGNEPGPDADEQNPSFRLKDHDTWEKLKRRFVLVCADDSEARRFQRSWNHRALTTSRPRPGRFIVHASIISW